MIVNSDGDNGDDEYVVDAGEGDDKYVVDAGVRLY